MLRFRNLALNTNGRPGIRTGYKRPGLWPNSIRAVVDDVYFPAPGLFHLPVYLG